MVTAPSEKFGIRFLKILRFIRKIKVTAIQPPRVSNASPSIKIYLICIIFLRTIVPYVLSHTIRP